MKIREVLGERSSAPSLRAFYVVLPHTYTGRWTCTLYCTQQWDSGSWLISVFHCIHNDWLPPSLQFLSHCQSLYQPIIQLLKAELSRAPCHSCQEELLDSSLALSANHSLAPASHQNICMLPVSLIHAHCNDARLISSCVEIKVRACWREEWAPAVRACSHRACLEQILYQWDLFTQWSLMELVRNWQEWQVTKNSVCPTFVYKPCFVNTNCTIFWFEP